MDIPERLPVNFRMLLTYGGASLVIALCNDGTMWRLRTGDDDQWTQLPAIPQPRADRT